MSAAGEASGRAPVSASYSVQPASDWPYMLDYDVDNTSPSSNTPSSPISSSPSCPDALDAIISPMVQEGQGFRINAPTAKVSNFDCDCTYRKRSPLDAHSQNVSSSKAPSFFTIACDTIHRLFLSVIHVLVLVGAALAVSSRARRFLSRSQLAIIKVFNDEDQTSPVVSEAEVQLRHSLTVAQGRLLALELQINTLFGATTLQQVANERANEKHAVARLPELKRQLARKDRIHRKTSKNLKTTRLARRALEVANTNTQASLEDSRRAHQNTAGTLAEAQRSLTNTIGQLVDVQTRLRERTDEAQELQGSVESLRKSLALCEREAAVTQLAIQERTAKANQAEELVGNLTADLEAKQEEIADLVRAHGYDLTEAVRVGHERAAALQLQLDEEHKRWNGLFPDPDLTPEVLYNALVDYGHNLATANGEKEQLLGQIAHQNLLRAEEAETAAKALATKIEEIQQLESRAEYLLNSHAFQCAAHSETQEELFTARKSLQRANDCNTELGITIQKLEQTVCDLQEERQFLRQDIEHQDHTLSSFSLEADASIFHIGPPPVLPLQHRNTSHSNVQWLSTSDSFNLVVPGDVAAVVNERPLWAELSDSSLTGFEPFPEMIQSGEMPSGHSSDARRISTTDSFHLVVPGNVSWVVDERPLWTELSDGTLTGFESWRPVDQSIVLPAPTEPLIASEAFEAEVSGEWPVYAPRLGEGEGPPHHDINGRCHILPSSPCCTLPDSTLTFRPARPSAPLSHSSDDVTFDIGQTWLAFPNSNNLELLLTMPAVDVGNISSSWPEEAPSFRINFGAATVPSVRITYPTPIRAIKNDRPSLVVRACPDGVVADLLSVPSRCLAEPRTETDSIGEELTPALTCTSFPSTPTSRYIRSWEDHGEEAYEANGSFALEVEDGEGLLEEELPGSDSGYWQTSFLLECPDDQSLLLDEEMQEDSIYWQTSFLMECPDEQSLLLDEELVENSRYWETSLVLNPPVGMDIMQEHLPYNVSGAHIWNTSFLMEVNDDDEDIRLEPCLDKDSAGWWLDD